MAEEHSWQYRGKKRMFYQGLELGTVRREPLSVRGEPVMMPNGQRAHHFTAKNITGLRVPIRDSFHAHRARVAQKYHAIGGKLPGTGELRRLVKVRKPAARNAGSKKGASSYAGG